MMTLGALGLSGCSALDVNSPTTLRAESLQNAYGAALAVSGVRQVFSSRFNLAMQGTGVLTDELWSFDILNSRRAEDYYELIRTERANGIYYFWQEAYRKATIALPLVKMNAIGPGKGAMVGEVYALRGFMLIGLAEHVCPGFPIINLDIDGDVITPHYTSDPQTSDSVFNRAVADFDSAMAYAGDSVRVSYLAQIGKARALLGLGRFSDAAETATSVPTEYVYETIPTYMGNFRQTHFVIQAHEGGNGIDFVSPNDPRVPLVFRFPSDFGNLTSPTKYYSNPPGYRPIVLASGIEARLIESEGQLAEAPDGTAWLSTLNALRTTVALSDTTNPATLPERVDLLFRERAFWLFGTGHRLGDFRRLMARYNRDPETLFPTGTVQTDGKPYGTLTSIPFDGDYEHLFNPKITGCTGP